MVITSAATSSQANEFKHVLLSRVGVSSWFQIIKLSNFFSAFNTVPSFELLSGLFLRM